MGRMSETIPAGAKPGPLVSMTPNGLRLWVSTYRGGEMGGTSRGRNDERPREGYRSCGVHEVESV